MRTSLRLSWKSLSVLSIAALLTACGDGSDTTGTGTGTGPATGTGGATSSSGTGGAGGAGQGGAGGGGGMGGFTTLFTIVFENHDYNEIVGSPDAPYLNSLIQTYGLATNYKDSGTHPSLPNYLYMVSGDTQYIGIVDLDPTIFPFPVDSDNLGHQMTVAGIPWRSYQESMGTPCKLSGAGNYAPRHDPFLYFDNIQNDPGGLCAETSVDYSMFPADLAGGGYKYMWITPNLINDGHDPATDPVQGLQQTDAWAAIEIPKILSSEAFTKGGILFITWDEAEGRNGNDPDQIPMIIVSPKIVAPGFTSATPLDHASYLATIEDLFGLPRLGAAAGATSLMEFLQ